MAFVQNRPGTRQTFPSVQKPPQRPIPQQPMGGAPKPPMAAPKPMGPQQAPQMPAQQDQAQRMAEMQRMFAQRQLGSQNAPRPVMGGDSMNQAAAAANSRPSAFQQMPQDQQRAALQMKQDYTAANMMNQKQQQQAQAMPINKPSMMRPLG